MSIRSCSVFVNESSARRLILRYGQTICQVKYPNHSAIVTSSNESLAGNQNVSYWRFAGRSNVDGEVRDAAGPKLATVLRGKILPLNKAICTPSFDLELLTNSEHIIHVNFPDGLYGSDTSREKNFSIAIENILQVAEENGIIALALPALGCGVKGWHPARAASLIIQRLQTSSAHIKQFEFIIIDSFVWSIWTEIAHKQLPSCKKDAFETDTCLSFCI